MIHNPVKRLWTAMQLHLSVWRGDDFPARVCIWSKGDLYYIMKESMYYTSSESQGQVLH